MGQRIRWATSRNEKIWHDGIIVQISEIIGNNTSVDLHICILGKFTPGTLRTLKFPESFHEVHIVTNDVANFVSVDQLKVGSHIRFLHETDQRYYHALIFC